MWLLQKTQPLIAIVLASFWLRERLSATAWVLVPVALIGAYLIAVPAPLHPEQAWADFHGWRVNYDDVLLNLAGLVMAPVAPWSSDRARPYQRPRLSFRRRPTHRAHS